MTSREGKPPEGGEETRQGLEAFPRQRLPSRPLRPSVWSLAEVLSRVKKSSRGKKSLARLARLNAWSLAEFFAECRGLWQADPWYPGFHWTDSSPRARDGHAGAPQAEANRRGPKEACEARDTWSVTAGHDPTISSEVTGVVVGPATSR